LSHLKKLYLGWEGVTYPDKPNSAVLTIYPGFTKEEAEKLQADCLQAGIDIEVKYLPPKMKYVQYKSMPKDEQESKWPISVSHVFHYPWDGYEKLCEEKGCDPATGLPFGGWNAFGKGEGPDGT